MFRHYISISENILHFLSESGFTEFKDFQDSESGFGDPSYKVSFDVFLVL